MNQKSFRIALFALLLLSSLACQAISGIGEKIGGVQSTVQSAATQAMGIATQAIGLATEVGSIATQAAPLLETAQAVATEKPSAAQTAMATTGFQPGTKPENIPLVDENTITNYFGTAEMATYSTSLGFQDVVEFYRTNMPAYGWTQDTNFSYESTDTVMLYYKNNNSKIAVITITANPANNLTTVAIVIQSQ